MRNGVRLYIGARQADLDDASFILLNYTQEDLDNPTVVRNSFSRQITLKGTPRNDEIFGHIHRNDRVTQYNAGDEDGIYFDPTRKTTFTLYNDRQEILETGYLKLDEIVTTRRSHSYKVTLYGGLGSFLYGLSYDANGDKLTLADLDFGETLGFTINRTAVSDAWARLGGDTSKAAKWDIVNFAPCYAGLPPSPFDAGKCVVDAASVGLLAEDGDYSALNGMTVVALNDKVTGNEAKDYRSYLQKPVIRMKSVIDAICDPSNNGGWTVNQDAEFFDDTNPYWSKTWLTLPSLNDLNISETQTSTTQTMTAVDTVLPITGGGGSGMYSVTVNAQPKADMTGIPSASYIVSCQNTDGAAANLVTMTVTLYDSSNNAIATAVYRAVTTNIYGFFPTPDFTFDHISSTGAFVDAGNNQVTFPLFVSAQGAASYMVHLDVESYYSGRAGYDPGDTSGKMWQLGDNVFANGYALRPVMTTATVDVVGYSSSTVRTGASIAQGDLLGSSRTPADYLLSYCKTFGLVLLAHKDTKTVDVVLRKNFYSGTTVDLSGRVDRGREAAKRPFAFDAKWYAFGTSAQGEYAEYYRNKFGRNYGAFRVNTGYGFDASEKDVTEGIAFRNLVTVTETSKYFCEMATGGQDVPSVFLSGGSYSLYKGGETTSVGLPNYFDAARTWSDPSYPMHDDFPKLQVHGSEWKALDECDTLVFFDGMESVSSLHLSLTDDTEVMLYLNGNNPCWMPHCCSWEPGWKISSMPRFGRYLWSGTTVTHSLDYGAPVEAQIPAVTFATGSAVFERYWERYLGDRYDDDSAVVTCYVDLRGFQVGADMLRDFYAFDGAIWSLNRIIDYSLTTGGPTRCEFVKVQDKANYLNY